MPPSDAKPIELHRADRGHDLWTAIEAARNGAIIENASPRTNDGRVATKKFIRCFSDCAEHWEDKSVEEKSWALEQLGSRVEALGKLHLYVYWTVLASNLDTARREPTRLPVAVLAIVGGDKSTITVSLTERPE